MSEIHKAAVQIALQENQDDVEAFEERAGESEISYEELLEDLQAHGKLSAMFEKTKRE